MAAAAVEGRAGAAGPTEAAGLGLRVRAAAGEAAGVAGLASPARAGAARRRLCLAAEEAEADGAFPTVSRWLRSP